ncbi:MAG TPA: DUF4405 domain-containing protein [Candidatus Cloacimonadota bacterium]|jgi:hypothetical protein|nr:DUF4405 domain-containing protein [Candidatus Cloacimonadota bacterium]
MKNWSRIKPKVNLVIDTIMFLDLMAVAGLGFLMKYVLLPGYKINEIYGTNTELFFLGLDRHQWGAIHLYLALFMVFLLVLHIIFHWGTIIVIFRQMIHGTTTRSAISILVVVLGLFLAISPFFVNPQITQMQRKHNRNRAPERLGTSSDTFNIKNEEDYVLTPENTTIPQELNLPDKPVLQPQEIIEEETVGTHRHEHNQVDIDGTMTLNQISVKYKVSVGELAKVIDVPVNYANERLGRLKKRYGFEMDKLRMFVISKLQDDDI